LEGATAGEARKTAKQEKGQPSMRKTALSLSRKGRTVLDERRDDTGREAVVAIHSLIQLKLRKQGLASLNTEGHVVGKDNGTNGSPEIGQITGLFRL